MSTPRETARHAHLSVDRRGREQQAADVSCCRSASLSTQPQNRLHTLPFDVQLCCVCTSLAPPQDIKFNVHAHPTLSEVLDELFKQAHVDGPAAAAPAAAKAGAKQPVAA